MNGNGRIRGRAPGKVILAGEHAVVYGRPALVLAVDRHAEADAKPLEDRRVVLDLPDYAFRAVLPRAELDRRAAALDRRFETFSRGLLPITGVLSETGDAAFYALRLVLTQPAARPGLCARLRADLPPGCGMGSSAASTLALLAAASAAAGVEAGPEDLLSWAQAVERLQHGRPSGADAWAALHGGWFRFAAGAAEPLPGPLPELTLIDTGRPLSGTGECVASVARRFGEAGPWAEFEETTDAVQQALLGGGEDALIAAVQRLHRRLCSIGVVPPRVAEFIAHVERDGGAAKICGGGGVRGEQAGLVWAVGGRKTAALCRAFGYATFTVKGTNRGVQIL